MKKIKCQSCVNYPAKERSKLRSKKSIACSFWVPNFSVLGPRFQNIQMWISKLTNESYELFKTHWNDQKPTIPKRLQKELKLLLNCRFKEEDFPFVDRFMFEQGIVNQVRPVPIGIGDRVDYRLSDTQVIKGRVARFTPEHVVISDGPRNISLVYATLTTPACTLR